MNMNDTTIDTYNLSEEQFKAALAKRTTTKQVFDNAPRIYDYMAEVFGTDCNDSVMREWAFQWWAEQTGEAYDVIYYRWLGE
jgi:hypothetical protein